MSFNNIIIVTFIKKRKKKKLNFFEVINKSKQKQKYKDYKYYTKV